MPLIGEAAPTVIGVVAFSALFAGLPKTLPEEAALGLIAPDILIYSFVTHASRHEVESADMTNDLFRRPFLAKQLTHEHEIRTAVVSVASGAAAPSARSPNRLGRAIPPIRDPAAVARELAANGATMASKLSRNLRLIEPLLS